MKTTFAILAICLTAACGGSGGSTSNTPTVTSAAPPAPTAPTPVEAAPTGDFGSMLNAVRANNGASAVTYNAQLGNAAAGHANDMLRNGFFSHTGSNGSSVGDRVTAAGYQWRTVGENIARGQRDEEAVLQAWVNSPGHQRNNVNPAFEDFALAKAGSGSQQYWVLVLAAPR